MICYNIEIQMTKTVKMLLFWSSGFRTIDPPPFQKRHLEFFDPFP